MSLWEQRRDSTKAYGTLRECGRGDDHLVIEVFSRGRDLSGWCEDKMLLTSTVYGGVYACLEVPEVGRVGGNNGGYWVGGWTVDNSNNASSGFHSFEGNDTLFAFVNDDRDGARRAQLPRRRRSNEQPARHGRLCRDARQRALDRLRSG